MLKFFALIYIVCGFIVAQTALSHRGFTGGSARLGAAGGAFLLVLLLGVALLQTRGRPEFLTMSRSLWGAMIIAFVMSAIGGCFIK